MIRLALIGGTVLLSLLVLMRLLPVVRFVLPFVILILVIVIGTILFRKHWRVRRTQKAYARSLAGRVDAKISECEGQVERLEAEIARIERSHQDLRRKLNHDDALPEGVRDRTEHLLRGFEQELRLRRTKVSFYVRCIQKLRALKRRHELLDELDRKRSELEGYREQHYDDIADMEAVRWEVERETTSLETIQDLAGRVRRSEMTDDVLHLQKELDKMVRE